MYRVCSACSADGALLKCACLSAYYCNLKCQIDHRVVHQCVCTEHRLKLIEQRRVELDRLKAQGSAGVESVVELMVLEQELAREHCHVGGLMGRSLRPTVYSQA